MGHTISASADIWFASIGACVEIEAINTAHAFSLTGCALCSCSCGSVGATANDHTSAHISGQHEMLAGGVEGIID
jgi:hypothetical protein